MDNRYETLLIPESEDLKEIRAYIQLCGFNTIFDVLDAELRELKVRKTYIQQQRKLRKWLQGTGPGAILSLYLQHLKLDLPNPVKESITQLFTQMVSQEVSDMLKEQSLRRLLKDYEMDIDFSFDAMASTFIAAMPSLSTVLHTAFTPDLNIGIVRESVPESDPAVLSRENLHIQGHNLMVNTALAILCHAKSVRVNVFQGHIGYFLYTSKIPKRIIETIHRFGLSVKYESIIEAMKAMAASTSKQLQKWKFQVPAPFSVFDNLN